MDQPKAKSVPKLCYAGAHVSKKCLLSYEFGTFTEQAGEGHGTAYRLTVLEAKKSVHGSSHAVVVDFSRMAGSAWFGRE